MSHNNTDLDKGKHPGKMGAKIITSKIRQAKKGSLW